MKLSVQLPARYWDALMARDCNMTRTLIASLGVQDRKEKKRKETLTRMRREKKRKDFDVIWEFKEESGKILNIYVIKNLFNNHLRT